MISDFFFHPFFPLLKAKKILQNTAAGLLTGTIRTFPVYFTFNSNYYSFT